MNKKGQVGIGSIILAFIVIIVGIIVVIQGTAPSIGTLTQTAPVVNSTQTFPPTGSTLTLNGQAVTNLIVSNRTGQAVVPASNYTITNRVLTNGVLTTVLTPLVGPWNNSAVNLSYTYEPFGYQTDSGNRAVTNLIPFLSALGIAIVVLGLAFKDSILDMLGS